MPTWKIAVVQMDCKIADNAANLEAIRARLREAAAQGAKLVVFPECVLPGYCYESKAEASRHMMYHPPGIAGTTSREGSKDEGRF